MYNVVKNYGEVATVQIQRGPRGHGPSTQTHGVL